MKPELLLRSSLVLWQIIALVLALSVGVWPIAVLAAVAIVCVLVGASQS